MSRKFPKHSQLDKLFYTEEDLRWATPEIVADYRAERLKCKIIADIGCGIGLQTFSFAKVCPKVYAVEIDSRKLELAKKNAAALGLKNITFILGDALNEKIIKKISDAEIIFCDPERLPEEEERKKESISPNLDRFLALYSVITSKIAVEFPPQIKSLSYEAEREYVSLHGQLNRLTLYFGGLKKAERSAVVLPEKEILLSNKASKVTEEKLGQYLLEVDSAVVKAELLGELAQETKTELFASGKNIFFTSEKLVQSPFFKNNYEVLETGIFEEKNILEKLRKVHAGKVTLRLEVNPKQYWSMRKSYEKHLCGEKTVALFKFGAKAVIAEKC